MPSQSQQFNMRTNLFLTVPGQFLKTERIVGIPTNRTRTIEEDNLLPITIVQIPNTLLTKKLIKDKPTHPQIEVIPPIVKINNREVLQGTPLIKAIEISHSNVILRKIDNMDDNLHLA